MKTATRFNTDVMRVRLLPAVGLLATIGLLLLVSPGDVSGQTFPAADSAWTPILRAGAPLQDAGGDNGTSFNGTPDYFLDLVVPRDALLAAARVNETTAIRLLLGVSSAEGSLNGDVAGGTAGGLITSSAVGSDQVTFPIP